MVIVVSSVFLSGTDAPADDRKRWGELAGGFEYLAVNAAIARFEQRLKIYRELQKKIKKVAKELNIEISTLSDLPRSARDFLISIAGLHFSEAAVDKQFRFP